MKEACGADGSRWGKNCGKICLSLEYGNLDEREEGGDREDMGG